MTTTTAISSGTAAASSSTISVADGSSIQVWTSPAQLAGDEWVDVYREDSGATVEVRVMEGVAPVRLTSKRPSVVLNGPGEFILKKSETSTATAVFYDA